MEAKISGTGILVQRIGKKLGKQGENIGLAIKRDYSAEEQIRVRWEKAKEVWGQDGVIYCKRTLTIARDKSAEEWTRVKKH